MAQLYRKYSNKRFGFINKEVYIDRQIYLITFYFFHQFFHMKLYIYIYARIAKVFVLYFRYSSVAVSRCFAYLKKNIQ